MQFVDLGAQYRHLQSKIDARIRTVLEHGQFIMGPEVSELEAALSAYVGVEYAITCANGTDALSLALITLNIKPGDAVFCPTFTYISSAEAIATQGATPRFVDSDATSYNLCPLDLRRQIEKVVDENNLRPRAIIAVDLFGLPANYPELKQLAEEFNLKIIEDAAQGFGGTINQQQAGSFGDIAITSFFPTKPLGCYGDGGALFTQSPQYAETLRSVRAHGRGNDKDEHLRVGMNSRLDTLQAAILLAKLDEFSRELSQRQLLARNYTKQLPKHLSIPRVPPGYTSSWAQYTVTSTEREQEREHYRMKNIPTCVYYKKCLHQQPAFNYLGYKTGDFPIAERLADTVFSLPIHGYLSTPPL